MKKLILSSMAVSLLAACSISGYGGASQFRCTNKKSSKDPRCASITHNYQASVSGSLLSDGDIQPRSVANVQAVLHQPISSGTPIRSQSEIARVWIAPYLDNDGDLIDQSYVYLTLNQGKWLIAHNEQAIVEEFRPIRLLGTGQNVNTSTKSSTTATKMPMNTPIIIGNSSLGHLK